MSWVCSYGVTNCTVCRRPPLRSLAAYRAMVPQEDRLWLVVRFAEKDKVKALGARWCPDRRAWYADRKSDTKPFGKWLSPADRLAASKERLAAVKAKPPAATIIDTPPMTMDELMESATSVADSPIDEPAPGVASFDELMAAIAWADQQDQAPQTPAVVAPVEHLPAELVRLVSRTA